MGLLEGFRAGFPKRNGFLRDGAVLAGLCLAAIPGCDRDFGTPWTATGPDTTVVAVDPDPIHPDTADADTVVPPVVKPPPVLIQSLYVPDLVVGLGETRPAAVQVRPSDATSPLYEMTSDKPGVAEVTPDGLRGKGLGTATVTVNALDGSGKSARFKVTVELIRIACVLDACACGYDGKGNGKGGDRCEG